MRATCRTPAFKENTIDTAWLDGIIAEKSVAVEVDPEASVINAAVFRAYNQIQGAIAGFKTNLAAGQLSTLPLREMQSSAPSSRLSRLSRL